MEEHSENMKIKNYEVTPALVVIDMQNGFASKGGSYDALGIEISNYRKVSVAFVISLIYAGDRKSQSFTTRQEREPSGIDPFNKGPQNSARVQRRKDNEEAYLR